MGLLPKGWGDYPPEYNREIHGPYNPSTYYGKRDTPLSEVKLGDLAAWLGRRNKSPRAMMQAMSRAWWRYTLTWVNVKKPGPAFLYQTFAGCIFIFFLADYNRLKEERWYRYH